MHIGVVEVVKGKILRPDLEIIVVDDECPVIRLSIEIERLVVIEIHRDVVNREVVIDCRSPLRHSSACSLRLRRIMLLGLLVHGWLRSCPCAPP